MYFTSLKKNNLDHLFALFDHIHSSNFCFHRCIDLIAKTMHTEDLKIEAVSI